MSIAPVIYRFLHDETAATSIEYGLIASLMAAGLIPVVGGLGGKMASAFSKIAAAMQDAPPVPSGAAAI